MIPEPEFDNLIRDLEMYFKEELDDWQKEQYYKNLKDTDKDIFKKTINYAMAHFKRFPKIAHLIDIIDDYRKELYQAKQFSRKPDDPSRTCGRCEEGLLPPEEYKWDGRPYAKTTFCDCEIGQALHRGWIKEIKKGWGEKPG